MYLLEERREGLNSNLGWGDSGGAGRSAGGGADGGVERGAARDTESGAGHGDEVDEGSPGVTVEEQDKETEGEGIVNGWIVENGSDNYRDSEVMEEAIAQAWKIKSMWSLKIAKAVRQTN